MIEDAFTRRHGAMLLEHVDYGIAREVVLAGLSGSTWVCGSQRRTSSASRATPRTSARSPHADARRRGPDGAGRGRMGTRDGYRAAEVIDPLVELVQEEGAGGTLHCRGWLWPERRTRLIADGGEARQQGALARRPARHQRKHARRKSS